MTLKYARHTNNLKDIIRFYTKIIGLIELGGFENHAGYDGVFLGKEYDNWHLEFTSSNGVAKSMPDEDDALVFYMNSKTELDDILNRISLANIKKEEPKNVYWKEHGTMIKDPDRYNVNVCLKP